MATAINIDYYQIVVELYRSLSLSAEHSESIGAHTKNGCLIIQFYLKQYTKYVTNCLK